MIPNISTIDLFQLASGDIFTLQVYKFIGKQPGKKAYIQANLHGVGHITTTGSRYHS